MACSKGKAVKVVFIWLSICVPVIISGTAFSAEADKREQVYRFAVFPYLSPVRLHQIYAPITNAMSKRFGTKVKFTTSSNFKGFLQKLRNKQFDFALIQPFWYPIATDQSGYIPLVRMQEPFVAMILVLDSSPLVRVSDLQRKVIATPPSFVPVVHLARLALAAEGIDPDTDLELRAYKSVESCLQQLLINTAQACVAPPFAPGVFEQAMDIKLRSLLISPAIPNLALVSSPAVPAEQRDMLVDLFTSWHQAKQGSRYLEGIQTQGFVAIDDSEYDIVRQFVKEIQQ